MATHNHIPNMAEVLSPITIGSCSLSHYTVSRTEAMLSGIRGGLFACGEGTYALLKINGRTWMSDTRMERITNYEIIWKAVGDVLVAGLGIGMIAIPICRNPMVRSLTILENNADVITAIEPQLRSYLKRDSKKLTVHHADCREWEPTTKGRQFDAIYLDIWRSICADNWTEMKQLRRRYAKWLKRGGFAASWSQDQTRAAAVDGIRRY